MSASPPMTAEPLEERCALVVAQFFGENDSPLDAARAVLALVRQEQEKAGHEHDSVTAWLRAWWLHAHRAPGGMTWLQ